MSIENKQPTEETAETKKSVEQKNAVTNSSELSAEEADKVAGAGHVIPD